MEKVKTYLLIAAGLMIGILGLAFLIQHNELKNSTNILTAQDRDIQQLNVQLGLAEATLFSEQVLNKKYKKEISDFPQELNRIIEEHNLRLQSRDQTIAQLKNKLIGGTTTVVVRPVAPILGSLPGSDEAATQQISYEWKDTTGRFHLIDPDIFIKHNEVFTSQQNIKVLGHVFYGKDGRLQIRKMELQEVIEERNPDGTINYKPIDGSNIKIVDSDFEYANTSIKKDKQLLDIFKPRLLASYDTELTPGIGIEILNIGNILDYINIGINTKISADLTDPLKGSLGNSRISAGISYSLLKPLIDTNFAIGASIGTPFNKFANNWVFTVDALLYLTN